MCKITVEHVWNTCGTRVEHVWNTCGTRAAHTHARRNCTWTRERVTASLAMRSKARLSRTPIKDNILVHARSFCQNLPHPTKNGLVSAYAKNATQACMGLSFIDTLKRRNHLTIYQHVMRASVRPHAHMHTMTQTAP